MTMACVETSPKIKIPKVLSDTGNLDHNNISINVKVTFFRQIFHFHFYWRKFNFVFRESFVDKDTNNHR
jgi:hypothetical protein